jgi:hypothetical protein
MLLINPFQIPTMQPSTPGTQAADFAPQNSLLNNSIKNARYPKVIEQMEPLVRSERAWVLKVSRREKSSIQNSF